MIGITWKESYATHVECFDEEHKRLVSLIDKYFRAIRENHNDEIINECLEKALDYATDHFAHEEELMRNYSYPHYHAHRQEHIRVKATIRGLKLLLSEGGDDHEDVLLAFRNLLREWLLDHIVEHDHKYGPFFREMGVN